MAKVSLLVSCLALAAAGFLGWRSWGAAGDLERLRAEVEGLAALEARMDALEGVPAPTPAPAPVAGLGAPPAVDPADPLPLATPAAGRTAVVPSRLADLEKRLTALEGRALAEEHAGPLATRPQRLRMAGPGGGRFYAALEDAKEDLDLTDGQQADFERILGDARREAEALRKVPDDEGKTWEQVQREAFQTSDGALRLDFTKFESFRKKTIPGRSETYDQADRRIREEAKRRMRDTLSTAQQEKFDKATVDPLLGGGTSASFVTFGAAIDVAPDEAAGR